MRNGSRGGCEKVRPRGVRARLKSWEVAEAFGTATSARTRAVCVRRVVVCLSSETSADASGP